MAEIIDLRSRAENIRQSQDARLRIAKLNAVRKHFQCMRCAFRCARCGSQLGDEDRNVGEPYNAPYAFCRICYEEYREYRKKKSGQPGNPDYYWHNEAWMQLWDAWLDYQEKMEKYRSSPEFLRLLEEVESFMER
ncbi:hypothetical protein [Thermodesulforhabdus norvegica]|uniref:Uncharacterized protein n=1 Tax=Thermodesulforhabdus norvegica TaxID=39841 RepID=A0A1I4UUV8_9BACT|nr:hypothetical protein [Thermodesulforhabdus norvegica]SFM92784.1 hypothetical protein SAMN05660836_01978 [Thermodesulforhabdus norvegica]